MRIMDQIQRKKIVTVPTLNLILNYKVIGYQLWISNYCVSIAYKISMFRCTHRGKDLKYFGYGKFRSSFFKRFHRRTNNETILFAVI